MDEFYRAKFNELFLEFNRYTFENPGFTENFPQGSEVILLDSHDAGYSSFMLKHAPKGRNIVFVDVGVLGPVHSRLKYPKLVARPPISA